MTPNRRRFACMPPAPISRARRSKRKSPRRRGAETLRRRLLGSALKILLGLILVSVLQVAVLRFINPPFTLAMGWDYAKSVLTLSPYPRIQWRWQPLAQISPRLQRAVLAGEDQRFSRHHGFDLVEIQASVKDMVTDGRLRGASTITMQTARTLFLLPSRNLVRKILEAYYTVLLELFWNKRRILEVYLNTVDWGDSIVGAEAAARTYFKCSSKQLSARQAALLAAVLPNPHRFSPSRPTAYVNQRARRILADVHKMPIL